MNKKMICNKCGSDSVKIKEVKEKKGEYYIHCENCGYVYFKENMNKEELVDSYNKDTEQ